MGAARALARGVVHRSGGSRMLTRRPMDETGEEDLRGPLRRMLSDRYAHYRRVSEILGAISRYGFGRAGDLAASLKEVHLDAEEDGKVAGMGAPVRFRMMLERLGPTFIKLGQMLSTRPDLISEEYAAELGKLRDMAPPVPTAEVRAIVESELGMRVEEAFDGFGESALASASIGQVHRARLRGTATEVAVKVQRPGADELVRVDLEVLKDLAGTLARVLKGVEGFDPEGAVVEFERMITREVDYTVEARNIERFRANMASVEGVLVPRVHWGLSTRKVLTMDFIEGAPMGDAGAVRGLGADPDALVATVGRAYVKQIFVDGFFHADPHHGNLLVTGDGKVAFLDLGGVGYIDDATRERATDLYISVIRGDPKAAAAALVALAGTHGGHVDVPALEWALQDYIDYTRLRKDAVGVDQGMNQRLVTIALRNGIRPPSSFVLLERALLEVEGVCRGLAKDFDIMELARANLPQLLKARYAPDLDPLRTADTVRGYRRLLQGMPQRLDNVLRKVEEDDVTIKLDRAYLDELRRTVRAAALMVGVSLMAMSMVFYVVWAGPDLNMEAVHVSLSVPAIVAVWALVVWRIWRRS